MKPKYVILSHGRAGTSFCAQNMRAHPEIAAFFEPFHAVEAKRAKVGEQVWHTQTSSMEFARKNVFENPALLDKARGFKLFYFHCRENPVASDIWRGLRQDRSVKIIFLNRRNLFNKYLSDQRAIKSGVWHPSRTDYLKSQYDTRIDLQVDVQACLKTLQYLFSSYNLIREQFDGHDHIEWFHEDLPDRSAEFMTSIYDFLGVAQLPVSVPFRAGTLSLETTRIENLEEVRDVIGSSIFSDFLKDCPLIES